MSVTQLSICICTLYFSMNVNCGSARQKSRGAPSLFPVCRYTSKQYQSFTNTNQCTTVPFKFYSIYWIVLDSNNSPIFTKSLIIVISDLYSSRHSFAFSHKPLTKQCYSRNTTYDNKKIKSYLILARTIVPGAKLGDVIGIRKFSFQFRNISLASTDILLYTISRKVQLIYTLLHLYSQLLWGS